jgi:hypothetical protein
MVGDPTILVAHWCEEPKRVQFFEVPSCDFNGIEQELQLRFSDAAGTIEKLDKKFMEWQLVKLNKEQALDNARKAAAAVPKPPEPEPETKTEPEPEPETKIETEPLKTKACAPLTSYAQASAPLTSHPLRPVHV